MLDVGKLVRADRAGGGHWRIWMGLPGDGLIHYAHPVASEDESLLRVNVLKITLGSIIEAAREDALRDGLKDCPISEERLADIRDRAMATRSLA